MKFQIRLKKYFLNTFLAFLLLANFSYAKTKNASRSTPKVSAKSETVTIVKILDGDTYDLSDGRRVRMLGIDTPEKGEPYADSARNLANSFLKGKQVTIDFEKNQKDRYDRYLVYLHFQGILVNKLFLERGFARLYLFSGTRRYNSELITAQKLAREQKIGIWSLPEPDREPFYIFSSGSYRFHRPLCPLIKNINPKKAKRYKTRDAALDAGLSPCRECRP